MTFCTVKSCKIYHKKCTKGKDGISFHRFPSDPIRREVWNRILRLERGEPYYKALAHTRICSSHFYDDDYITTKSGLRKLKETAQPRLSVANNTKAQTRATNSETKSQSDSQTATIDSLTEVMDSQNEEIHSESIIQTEATNSQEDLIDVDISDLQSIFDSPRKVALKKSIKKLLARDKIKSQKIKHLRSQNKRLKKKIMSLVDIVKQLGYNKKKNC